MFDYWTIGALTSGITGLVLMLIGLGGTIAWTKSAVYWAIGMFLTGGALLCCVTPLLMGQSPASDASVLGDVTKWITFVRPILAFVAFILASIATIVAFTKKTNIVAAPATPEVELAAGLVMSGIAIIMLVLAIVSATHDWGEVVRTPRFAKLAQLMKQVSEKGGIDYEPSLAPYAGFTTPAVALTQAQKNEWEKRIDKIAEERGEKFRVKELLSVRLESTDGRRFDLAFPVFSCKDPAGADIAGKKGIPLRYSVMSRAQTIEWVEARIIAMQKKLGPEPVTQPAPAAGATGTASGCGLYTIDVPPPAPSDFITVD